MAKSEELHFKISTGLKDLLGRDLITDEFIAVFELVKNSYDAGAQNVYIEFFTNSNGQDSIAIIDDGKGMDLSDLKEKWFFVAYSAKKEGVEDEDSSDYRENIKAKRYYAGAKGVGRFSCDRLGSTLDLYSKKKIKNSIVEYITVKWDAFEKDSKSLFKDVPIQRNVNDSFPNRYSNYSLSSGTILEISGLRDDWDREKILDLKSSLAKLILPKMEDEFEKDSFSIEIISPKEKEKDSEIIEDAKSKNEEVDEKRLVNSRVQNFVFDTLNLKSTQIFTSIQENGKTIRTKLLDRGEFIYEIEEENEFNFLSNISLQIFYLNRAAKWNFTHQMNIEPVNYGNLFMYKNGFRIHPYGNPRDDSYGIDARKTQGYSRYIGTREMIGKIEIKGDNPLLRETTSRDGGLIKNSAFKQLVKYLFKTLSRLEKYVVDAKEWGVDDEDIKDLKDGKSEEGIVKLLSNLSTDKKVLNISYNDDITDILNIQEEKSAKKLVRNFKRIAKESEDSDLLKKANQLEKKLNTLQQAKTEAEKQIKEQVKKHKKEKENLLKTNKYLLSVSKDLSPEAIGLVHHIGHKLSQTSPLIELLIKKVSKQKISNDELLNKLSIIKHNTDQVEKISRLVTRSNFNLMVSEEKGDIVSYIKEYIKLHREINEFSKIKIEIEDNVGEFNLVFSKIDISLILDNLISNARKAKATKAKILFDLGKKDSLVILFSDNGKGVNKNIEDKLFDLGITTTVGAGAGLFTNKKIINDMGGNFEFSGNAEVLSGATFKIEF